MALSISSARRAGVLSTSKSCTAPARRLVGTRASVRDSPATAILSTSAAVFLLAQVAAAAPAGAIQEYSGPRVLSDVAEATKTKVTEELRKAREVMGRKGFGPKANEPMGAVPRSGTTIAGAKDLKTLREFFSTD